jgi:tRNA uridine 5-carboxymethylaminomethyl modification enzyme
LSSSRLRKSDPAYAAVATQVSGELGEFITLSDLAKRQGITPEIMRSLLPAEISTRIGSSDLEFALADNLYAGYIKAQEAVIDRINHHDSTPIPQNTDFGRFDGLSHEMVERLERVKPATFGEARSIPGMTPAALSTLLVGVSSSS